MKYFRITLAQIEDLIERDNGATTPELKLLWNDLSEAITINEENKLNEGDIVRAFNGAEWSKTGDLPEGNEKYYQKATILRIRTSKSGEKVGDVLFKNGKESNGHFLRCLTKNLYHEKYTNTQM